MKTTLFLILSVISLFVSAQFERSYVKAEIHFKNNEILNGYIFDDFAQNDWYGKGDLQKTSVITGNATMNYPSTASSFQTIIKTIQFKQNENDGQQTVYESENINFIVVDRDGEAQKYITTKVVRSDFKNEEPVKFDTLQRNIWLPVKTEGRINMYGFYTWAVKPNNGWAEVYFQRQGDKYSINPLLSHKFTLSINSQRLQIKASLLKIFHDCPEFEANIESIIDGYIEDFHIARKFSKEDRALIKKQPKEKRGRIEYEIREKRSFIPYENILNKYYSYCSE